MTSAAAGISSLEWKKQMSGAAKTGGEEQLVITRLFDAPRDLVFKMWTDPVHLAKWWGPEHFTNPVCEVDARPGGKLEIHMRAPDGQLHPMTATYEEVVEPERLVMLSAAIEDEHGEAQLVVRNTVTFEDEGGKTKLTMHAVVVRATEMARGALEGMEIGWNQSFDKLAGYLAGS